MPMTNIDEAVPFEGQHTAPCHDCPMRLKSIPGWLGGKTAEEYVKLCHSDLKVLCHTLIGPQCAGVAIYRANVCKTPRDPNVLLLPRDTEAVFATPMAFLAHHDPFGDAS